MYQTDGDPEKINFALENIGNYLKNNPTLLAWITEPEMLIDRGEYRCNVPSAPTNLMPSDPNSLSFDLKKKYGLPLSDKDIEVEKRFSDGDDE